jgi:hypothetical protein
MSVIKKISWVFTAATLLTLTACSNLLNQPSAPAPVPPPPQPQVAAPGQLDVLMQYYDHIRKMSGTELVKEHDRVKLNLSLTKNDNTRAELALLLALPNTPFRDTGTAINLLNEMPKDAKPSAGMRGFKHLLSTLLAEQQRTNGSLSELSQKLREEQKHSEILKNQIDDIKSMERNLILRDKP